ncbi:hypothetical protein KSF73_01370 [Burkholderiaceae bacterium DAT-1]|nr:hypothetical protein [Burkholderiaceae bacterium DAT-1]
MSGPFLTHSPSPRELEDLQKFLGSFRDGTGNLREPDASTRADYRQIERCFAELLDGRTTENKAFYDFIVLSNERGGISIRGASVKSKEMDGLHAYSEENRTMRSYLELSNSAAKDLALCRTKGLTEEMFRNREHPEEFGATILERQASERLQTQRAYLDSIPGANKRFVEEESVYISLLYSPMVNGERTYLVSSFTSALQPPASWNFSGKRLVGVDNSGEVLYEWYALSGGQFKYYPKICDRIHGTGLFNLVNYKPAVESLRQKIHRMFER